MVWHEILCHQNKKHVRRVSIALLLATVKEMVIIFGFQEKIKSYSDVKFENESVFEIRVKLTVQCPENISDISISENGVPEEAQCSSEKEPDSSDTEEKYIK